MNYINVLSKELRDRAISLNSLGLSYSAWSYDDLMKVFSEIKLNGEYFVLGGDIWEVIDKKIKPAYINWYIEEDEINQSFELSLNKIKEINKINDNNFIYSIVVVTPEELEKLS